MNNHSIISRCRVCSSDLIEIVKFDPQYIATTFVKTNENNPMSKIKIPLTLMLCKNHECSLVQLKETVNPDLLYKNYFYRTAINEMMRRDLRELVNYALDNVNLNNDDVVVDIGANDCTMIGMFPHKLTRIAVEPATNIDWKHVDESINIVNEYFSKEVVMQETKREKVKIVTATAMFYDFDDPNIVTKEIKEILDDDGICVIQVSYLLDTIRDMNFYDAMHEHLEYYSLKSINYLMEKNGLTVIDASTNFVNGGSLRILVTHKETQQTKSERYERLLSEEKKWNLDEPETYTEFNNNIQDIIKKSKNFILEQIQNGKKIIGLGASSKGNVLLQICGFDNKSLPYICDRNKDKVGLHTLGTDFEIISEDMAHQMKPDLMLVIPWNFRDEILEREKNYIENGGKLLFLMPYPHYIDKNGETKLQ